jgi:hypothetical protein
MDNHEASQLAQQDLRKKKVFLMGKLEQELVLAVTISIYA